MARAVTNATGLQGVRETSVGVAGTTGWLKLSPNDLTQASAEITTVVRRPIGKDRFEKQGAVVDLDSGVTVELDAIASHFTDFAESFVYANYTGARVFDPSACDTDSFTVTANGAALVVNDLVYGRGFDNADNNGVHVVNGVPSTTDIPVATTLVAETAPAEATVELCGFRGASGDIEINASGNIASTVKDFTTLPLVPGMAIRTGGVAAANRFATTANNNVARIKSITTNEIVLENRGDTYVTDNGAGQQIDLFFGRFVKAVPTDDADFNEITWTFEIAYEDLGGVGTDEYEYPKGNYANELTVSLEVGEKATMTMSFIGQDTESPSTTRKTGADSAVDQNATTLYGAASDLPRLRLREADETGMSTDFKSFTMTINNNVSPEKVLGFLGSKFVNIGLLNVQLTAELLFTSSTVVSAIRNNERVQLDYILRNEDMGIMFDFPSMTLGGGARNFPLDESITIEVEGNAFKDAEYATPIMLTIFPFLPST